MEKELIIKIDEGKKCDRCGEGGAMPSGICLSCFAKMIKNGQIKIRKPARRRR